jgi:hypothetical protein
VDFLALGHPFVDAELAYVGSYDFGGLTAARRIPSTALKGKAGYLFVFIVRNRVTREDGDECLFRLEPVFVDSSNHVDEDALITALTAEATDSSYPQPSLSPDLAFETARCHLENKVGLWDWTDDVEFLSLSWVEFD